MTRPPGRLAATVYACLLGASWSAFLLPALALRAATGPTGAPLLALLAAAPLVVGALGPGLSAHPSSLDRPRLAWLWVAALVVAPLLCLFPGPSWQLAGARSLLGLVLLNRVNAYLLFAGPSLGWLAALLGAGLAPLAVAVVVTTWGEPYALLPAAWCGLAAFLWRLGLGEGSWQERAVAEGSAGVAAPSALARAAALVYLLFLVPVAVDAGHGWQSLGVVCSLWLAGFAPAYWLARRWGHAWTLVLTLGGLMVVAMAGVGLAEGHDLPPLLLASLGLGVGYGCVEAAGTFSNERLRLSPRLALAWQVLLVPLAGVAGLFFGYTAAMLLMSLLVASGAVACAVVSPRLFHRRTTPVTVEQS